MNSVQLTAIGVLLAALGACLFAVGASLQQQAVSRHRTGLSLPMRSMLAVVRTRTWLLGGLSSGCGSILHALALGLAPLSVVQPVGVLALGLTTIINARHTGQRLTGRTIAAVGSSTVGITAFLLLARSSTTARQVQGDSETAAATIAALVFALLVGIAMLGSGWERAWL